MSAFNEIYDSALTSFSDWIKVEDDKSFWTIEDFPYETGVVENLTKPHCEKCTAINKCWFKNEEGKKPDALDFFKEIKKAKKGLYHKYCHCKEKAIKSPNTKDIKCLMLDGKIKYFFKDKLGWFYAWGYTDEEKEEFVQIIEQQSKESYIKGLYEKAYIQPGYEKCGFKINIFITFPGKHEKANRVYNAKSCFMVFPNGTLKLNTLIGGKKHEDGRHR